MCFNHRVAKNNKNNKKSRNRTQSKKLNQQQQQASRKLVVPRAPLRLTDRQLQLLRHLPDQSRVGQTFVKTWRFSPAPAAGQYTFVYFHPILGFYRPETVGGNATIRACHGGDGTWRAEPFGPSTAYAVTLDGAQKITSDDPTSQLSGVMNAYTTNSWSAPLQPGGVTNITALVEPGSGVDMGSSHNHLRFMGGSIKIEPQNTNFQRGMTILHPRHDPEFVRSGVALYRHIRMAASGTDSSGVNIQSASWDALLAHPGFKRTFTDGTWKASIAATGFENNWIDVNGTVGTPEMAYCYVHNAGGLGAMSFPESPSKLWPRATLSQNETGWKVFAIQPAEQTAAHSFLVTIHAQYQFSETITDSGSALMSLEDRPNAVSANAPRVPSRQEVTTAIMAGKKIAVPNTPNPYTHDGIGHNAHSFFQGLVDGKSDGDTAGLVGSAAHKAIGFVGGAAKFLMGASNNRRTPMNTPLLRNGPENSGPIIEEMV